MKETNKSEKKCGNCRYFLKHYVFSGIELLSLLEGHCTYPTTRASKKKISIEKNCSCDKWQPYAMQVNNRRETIEVALKKIEERLNLIAIILKEDKVNDVRGNGQNE